MPSGRRWVEENVASVNQLGNISRSFFSGILLHHSRYLSLFTIVWCTYTFRQLSWVESWVQLTIRIGSLTQHLSRSVRCTSTEWHTISKDISTPLLYSCDGDIISDPCKPASPKWCDHWESASDMQVFLTGFNYWHFICRRLQRFGTWDMCTINFFAGGSKTAKFSWEF